MSTLGARIKARRKELGYTQDTMASRTGLSKGFLSDLENDKRGVGAESLVAIGHVLGLSLDRLMTGTGVEKYLDGELDLPASLAKYAVHAGLSFRDVLLLLRLKACLPGDPETFDWQKFHGAIGRFTG